MVGMRDTTDRARLLGGAIDPETGKRHRRRMSDQRLQNLADSPWLKVLQMMLMGILFPLLFWALNRVTDRLDAIDAAINRYATRDATTELRLQSLERSNDDLASALRLLSERSTEHSYRIRALEEKQGKH